VAQDAYPFSAGRVANLGWSIFRFAWRPMLVAATFILAPAYAISVPISATFSPSIDAWISEAQQAAQQSLPQPPLPENFQIAVIALIVSTLVVLGASLMASAAIVHIVDTTFRGDRVGALSAARFGLQRFGALVAAQILYVVSIAIIVMIGLMLSGALIIGAGLFAFVGLVALVGSVAGILFVVVRASLLVETISVEQLAGSVGFGRSWKLVSGNGWRVLGYLILLALVNLLVSVFIGSIAVAALGATDDSSSDIVVRSVIDAVIGILTSPITPVVLTLLYFDLRWQHGERVPAPGGGEVPGRPQPDMRPRGVR